MPTPPPRQLPPPNHPTLQVYVDESGTASQSRLLALGALVFRRDHGLVTNQMTQLRDRAGWRKEAHFVDINRTTAHLYREAADILAASDCRFVCCVVNKDDRDPFRSTREAWKVHAQLSIELLNAVIGRGQPILSVVVDALSTPITVNYEAYVATAVNRTHGYLAVAGVNRMDSRACVGLQLADLLTGAVAHQYRQRFDPAARAASPKGQVAQHVAQAWNLPSLVGANTLRLQVLERRPHIGQTPGTRPHRVRLGRSR